MIIIIIIIKKSAFCYVALRSIIVTFWNSVSFIHIKKTSSLKMFLLKGCYARNEVVVASPELKSFLLHTSVQCQHRGGAPPDHYTHSMLTLVRCV